MASWYDAQIARRDDRREVQGWQSEPPPVQLTFNYDRFEQAVQAELASIKEA